MAPPLLECAALLAAAIAGYALVQQVLRFRVAARHRQSLQADADGSKGGSDDDRGARGSLRRSVPSRTRALAEKAECRGGFERGIVEFLALTSLQCRMARPSGARHGRDLSETTTLLSKAGLGDIVSAVGYNQGRLRLGIGACAVGLGIGLAISGELAVLGAIAGLVVGWMAPRIIVKGRCRRRADELEHALPETLDVIALGLRGGLSFDRSLQLYTGHFSSGLARGLAAAETQWSHGLMSRADALHALAATYDSRLFDRVVETIIRSLRFGSSLAESLENCAVEARQTYQAKKQEQVAKAPVKIMLPTGTLILPAMLILVLGPVLLELIDSF